MSQNCREPSFTDFRTKTEFSDLEIRKNVTKLRLFRLRLGEWLMASSLPKARPELMSSGLRYEQSSVSYGNQLHPPKRNH